MTSFHFGVLLFSVIMFILFPTYVYLVHKKKDNDAIDLLKFPWFSFHQDKNKYVYLKYPNEFSGVVILPILDKTHIVFIKQYRNPLQEIMCELPRGFIDPNEDYQTAARRELHEETGYKTNSEVEYLGHITPDSGVLTAKVHLVKVHLTSSEKTQDQLDKDIASIELIPIANLEQRMKELNVIDSFTFAALYKAKIN